jgi:hypothetical protein
MAGVTSAAPRLSQCGKMAGGGRGGPASSASAWGAVAQAGRVCREEEGMWGGEGMCVVVGWGWAVSLDFA